MKLSALSLLLLLSIQFVTAQAPEKFNFQGVARGADGKLVKNVITRLRVTIHSEILTGQIVYQESHRPATNEHGIFTIAIGKGSVESGLFDKISWNTVNHFLQLELDPTGGTNYIDLGSTQLISVPYALQAREAGKWSDGTPVVQIMKFGSEIDINTDPSDPKLAKYNLPAIQDGKTLIWFPAKGSFRAGNAGNGSWDSALTGDFSFATGHGTEASGVSSVAIGTFTKALRSNSMSAGQNTEASGAASLSLGLHTKAMGRASVASGINVITKAAGSFAFGGYNNASDSPDPDNESDNDRIFQIGNGDTNKKLNALTLLRNGNLGLGNDVLEPKYILDIGARPRIRHNGATAGLWLDGSDNLEKGFIGMRADNEVGFFIDTWQLWVNNQGNAYLKGNVSLTSDARLKRNLAPLSGSLGKINSLIGYHYNWIDPKRDQTMQTGLIAQEVERLLPELVMTDDKGYKSINYIGLIPHLIESVKQLTKENESLKNSNSSIISRLEALEAASATNKITSTK